jgi:hypothetical protein
MFLRVAQKHPVFFATFFLQKESRLSVQYPSRRRYKIGINIIPKFYILDILQNFFIRFSNFLHIEKL